MKLVLDASAALAWMFERPDTEEAARADRLLDQLQSCTVLVPSLWYLEVANILLVAERRGVAKEAQVTEFINQLSRLPIGSDSTEVAHRQEAIIAIGRRYQLSAYDASYLELALRTSSTLATFDIKLAIATRQAGGQLFA